MVSDIHVAAHPSRPALAVMSSSESTAEPSAQDLLQVQRFLSCLIHSARFLSCLIRSAFIEQCYCSEPLFQTEALWHIPQSQEDDKC